MTRRRSISLVAVAFVASAALGAHGTSAAPPVEADAGAVIHWNQVAASTLAAVPGPNGGAPPRVPDQHGHDPQRCTTRSNAIGPKRHQPYLLHRRFGAKASTDAAVATAAYDVLSELVSTAPETAPFPGRAALLQTLSTEYAGSLGAIAGGPFKQQGIAAGHAAADAMLEARENDGRFGPSQWRPDARAGHWWPLLNAAGQPILDPTPWAGGVEPFLIQSSSQFRTTPPLTLDSAACRGGAQRGPGPRQSHRLDPVG